MRLLFAVLALGVLSHIPSYAQNCQTLSIRNAAGIMIGAKQICVDANGAWIDPARVNPSPAPAIQALTPPAPEPVILQPYPQPQTAIVPQTGYQQETTGGIVQPAPVILEAAPSIVAPPVSAATEVLQAEQPARLLNSIPNPPKTGAAKRQQLYAKLGLVCIAPDARHCPRGQCAGLCADKTGWCDGKTGEVYSSLEAIERVYCRKKKRR